MIPGMSTLPEPTPSPAVVWRPATIDDAARIADLHAAWAEAGGLTWRVSEEEIVHEMTSPAADPNRNVRVAERADGLLAAAVIVYHWVADGFKHRGYLDVTSLPDHADLELEAVRWGESRCREIFAAAADDMPRVIRVNADVRNASRMARLESLGFGVVRHFVDMVRPLDRPIADAALPPGVAIEPWSPGAVRGSWEAHCEAFADHWGSMPPTWEGWQHRFEASTFRPDLSVVAVADGDIVSYALNGVYPHDWASRGRREGWIETIGTRRAWRRRGLASALITESMRRFAAAGLDHAALDVDSDNHSGAFGLYTRLGFTEIDRTVELMKTVEPSGDGLES